MADRFPGEIHIGGKISRKQLPDGEITILEGLISALEDDGGSHHWGDSVMQLIVPNNNGALLDRGKLITDFSEELEGYVKDGYLVLKNDQARYGEFPETEEFCLKHDIAFDRFSDHYCEHDGEQVSYRSGMKRPHTSYIDSHGSEIVCGTTVRNGLLLIEKFRKNYGTSDDPKDWQNLDVGIRMLNDACPKQPEVLPKFEIVD